jgi:hypothetical protein
MAALVLLAVILVAAPASPLAARLGRPARRLALSG